MIPPQELGMKAFSRSVRGYEPAEVDDYVEFLIGKYTEIYKQCEIYDKRLRLVAQRIAELQEREEEIHNREENISKTMMSSQMIHDKTIEEAQTKADNVISQAEEAANKILEDARSRAQTALAAVNKKTEAQIEAARVKSENLYLASRTRCAKLLGDFKKEITNQKARMSALRDAADNFNIELGEAYRKQFDAIKSAAVYAPAIDFDKLSETRLFNMIMGEIKEDMAEIESKNKEAEYEFEKELMLLQNFDFADEYIKEYKTEVNSSFSNYNFEREENGEADNINEEKPADSESIYSAGRELDMQDDEDDDVKVFAGRASVSEPEAYQVSVSSSAVEEEPIATYDSDDYQEQDYSYGTDEVDYVEESSYENVNEDEEENVRGIFGFFKGFGKKKKADKFKKHQNSDEVDDIDNIYSELDDEDDDEKDNRIMDMFDGLGDEDED